MPVAGQEKAKSPQARVAKLPGTIQKVVIERAEIKLIDEVELAAARSGILNFVEPREGDDVRADQVVASLKDEVARAELKSAEAQAKNDIEIRYAQAAFQYAEMDLKKSLDVNKQQRGAVPEIELEEKRLATIKTQLQIDQAKWQYDVNQTKAEQAAAVLQQFSVVAPFDGVATKVLKSRGEAVREGDVILEITSTKRMKVEGYLHYTNALRVKQGDPVTVQLDIEDESLAASKRTFQGRIKYVDVKVSPVAEDVRVWAEVENADNIMRAGLEATMTIDLLGTDKRKAASR